MTFTVTFTRDEVTAIPAKHRVLVLECVKDYVSLNQFAA
jgi:hypothetical protein